MNKKLTAVSIVLFSLAMLINMPARAFSDTASQKPPVFHPFDPYKITPVNMTEATIVNAKNPPTYSMPRGIPLTNGTIRELPSSGPQPLDYTHHESWGTYIAYQSPDGQGKYPIMGMEAIQYINMSVYVPDGTLLYAPTMKGPDPCPIEESTVYLPVSQGGGGGSNYVGIDDWYTDQVFTYRWSFDWLNAYNYLSVYNGVTYYNVVIAKDSLSRWGFFLYNFNTGNWAELYAQSHDAYRNSVGGWVAYEARWTSGNWITTPYIESSNQEIYYKVSGSYIWSLDYSSIGYSQALDDSWLSETHGWWLSGGNYYDYYYDWYVGAHP